MGRRKHEAAEHTGTTRTERMVRLYDGTALALTVLVVVLAFLGRDNTYVEILAGCWIAEAAHFHKLYAQKEGRANSQKYMEAWVEQAADKYGAEQAARFAEIVLTTNTMQ